MQKVLPPSASAPLLWPRPQPGSSLLASSPGQGCPASHHTVTTFSLSFGFHVPGGTAATCPHLPSRPYHQELTGASMKLCHPHHTPHARRLCGGCSGASGRSALDGCPFTWAWPAELTHMLTVFSVASPAPQGGIQGLFCSLHSALRPWSLVIQGLRGPAELRTWALDNQFNRETESGEGQGRGVPEATLDEPGGRVCHHSHCIHPPRNPDILPSR